MCIKIYATVVKKQTFEKNVHACRVEGVFVVSDSTARQFKQFKALPRNPSSYSSDIDNKKFQKHRWASLTWLFLEHLE